MTRLDILVERRPPTTAHFVGQRVRQAYDDFTLPLRFALFLSVAPAHRRRAGGPPAWAVAAAAAACVALAERGRRRAGGTRVFPAAASLMAPLGGTERAITAWMAVAQRLLFGGTRYRDGRIARAATPPRELRERLAGLAPALSLDPPKQTAVR